MRTARDFGRDDAFVAGDFVRIDLAVMVDIEQREEPVGVGLHFVQRQLSVMIAVGLPEPVGETVIVAPVWPERLAHRGDEQPATVMRHKGRC